MKKFAGHIFLIGYMASGKTTLGRALADATKRSFIDLDDYIEARQGQSISEIFASRGESAFRDMEREALAEVAAMTDSTLVVACGGGTPCFGDNMELMERAGVTVMLEAPVDVILRRLRLERSKRPLVASLDGNGELEKYVRDNLDRRRPYYSRAAHVFDSSRLESVEEIDRSVKAFIAQVLGGYQS